MVKNGAMRVFNFSAGPAMMPEEVLEEARAELLDWQGSGMSVMEVSHRGGPFVACAADAEARLRALMGIPDGYRVLFLPGGAFGQFAGVPLNLTRRGDTVDFLVTGRWSATAAGEAERSGVRVQVVADEASSGYTTLPDPGSYAPSPGARYLHHTPNETIGGVEFDHVPDAGDVPVVADLSSAVLSRPIDVSRFGVIYAGTQKNLGPSGLVVVIVRDDLAGHARPECPAVLDYARMAAAGSMLNTPNTWAIYLLGRVLAWVERHGGADGMASRNRAKAEALYGYLDASDFYANPVAPRARSWMNVPFLLADPAQDGRFVSEAHAAGLTNLAGHRSVGGMRASIYNAMPLEGVRALIEFMAEFERIRG